MRVRRSRFTRFLHVVIVSHMVGDHWKTNNSVNSKIKLLSLHKLSLCCSQEVAQWLSIAMVGTGQSPSSSSPSPFELREDGTLFKKKKRKAALRSAVESLSDQQCIYRFGIEDADEEEQPEITTVVHKKRIVGGVGGGSGQRTGYVMAKRRRADQDEEEDAKATGDFCCNKYVGGAAPGGVADVVGVSRNGKDNSKQRETYYDVDEDDDNGKSMLEDEPSNMKTNDDGIYRGSSSYSTYTATPREGTKRPQKGPSKMTSNVRTVTAVDYQPDVCKDYKETGYCGFGDTCKFLHDRSDYLAGWQLELMPNSIAHQESEDEGSAEGEGDVPFACLICRKPFTNPVMTKCGHYFCQDCAIKRYAKSPKCFACGAQTQGIFNSAMKILERMQNKRKRREEEREKRRWNEGKNVEEESSSDSFLEGVEIGGEQAEEHREGERGMR